MGQCLNVTNCPLLPPEMWPTSLQSKVSCANRPTATHESSKLLGGNFLGSMDWWVSLL